MDQIMENKIRTNYYEHVYKNSIKSDIEIVVREKVIKAHKEVLASRNSVFLDELLSDPDLAKIEIVDLDPEAVEVFIHYLYTGNVPDGNISEELFQVAHRYLEPNLKNICRKELGQSLTVKNVAGRLLTFLKCKETKVIKEASTFFAKNFNDVKMYSDFDKVFSNEEATHAIFEALDGCKITILSKDKNPDRKQLIDSAKKSDLTIKVQDEQFLGHKELLSTRSTVFETVIAALPKTTNLSSFIDIPDFDSSTFKIFLNFIYTRIVVKKDISKELLIVAHKYVDSKLQTICEVNLLLTLREENAAELLILGTNVESKKLIEDVSKFIADRFSAIKERADFQQVKECPAAVEAVFSKIAVKIDNLYETRKRYKNLNSFKGIFTLKVPFAANEVYSDTFLIRKIPFIIIAELNLDFEKQYLQLSMESRDNNKPYVHKIHYTLELISNVDNKYNILQEDTDTFSSKDAGRGSLELFDMADVTDEEKGFMTDGEIKVKVYAKLIE